MAGLSWPTCVSLGAGQVLRSACRNRQPHVHGVENRQQCFKGRIARRGQCSIKRFPGDAGVPGNDRHAAIRFGEVPPSVQERLQSATQHRLETWADRVLDADRLDDIFG